MKLKLVKVFAFNRNFKTAISHEVLIVLTWKGKVNTNCYSIAEAVRFCH